MGAVSLCNDRMWRGTLSFGKVGLTARAVAGGPCRQILDVYLPGNDVDWGLDLGYSKFKLARPNGVNRGWRGIEGTTELIGPHADLMLDCWMA